MLRLIGAAGLAPFRLIRGFAHIAWADVVTVAVSLGLTEAKED